MLDYDLDHDLQGLDPEQAAGVAASAPRCHGDALRALADTMTDAYPDVSADGETRRQIGDTVLGYRLLDDGTTLKVTMTGAVENAYEIHGLSALAYNLREFIAQSMRG